MRPMPATGFNLEKLGASDFPESSQPPSIMGATSAATSIMSSTGTNACIACRTAVPACTIMCEASKAEARSNCRPLRSALSKCPPIMSPRVQRAPTPVVSMTKVTSSRDRATCPSSRAFSRRRGEAGSVFSRSLSSAINAPERQTPEGASSRRLLGKAP